MTTTYGVGNPNPSLEHARQKSGQLMESTPCPSDNWIFQPLYIYKQRIKSIHGSVKNNLHQVRAKLKDWKAK
jgi:hypothetical protein